MPSLRLPTYVIDPDFAPNGDLIDHVDIHSLRVTFATEAIATDSDPKSVQEILGHKTLDMTMGIYTKMHGQTKRQAVAGLRFGSGSQAPEHLVELPPTVAFPMQDGHHLVTEAGKRSGELTEVIAT